MKSTNELMNQILQGKYWYLDLFTAGTARVIKYRHNRGKLGIGEYEKIFKFYGYLPLWEKPLKK